MERREARVDSLTPSARTVLLAPPLSARQWAPNGPPNGPMTWRTEPFLPDLETGALAQSLLPALVIDAAAGALLAANAAGWEAWGLAAGNGSRPVALDRAMPALARLAQAARSADAATLTFWT